MDKRLTHHVGQAKRGNPKPVYAWIRSLSVTPWLVCLEICSGLVKKPGGKGWRSDAEPTEVKWIKGELNPADSITKLKPTNTLKYLINTNII